MNLFERALCNDLTILNNENVWREKDKFGNTPLHVLGFNGILAILNHPLVGSVSNDIHSTPLHALAMRSKSEILKHQLVSVVENDNGDTPLHLLAFTGNIEVLNHKDEIKTNNFVWNLEWCDAKYNTTYGSKSEINASLEIPVLQIDPNTNEIVHEFKSMTEAGKVFNCQASKISRVCSGERKILGGFKWRKK